MDVQPIDYAPPIPLHQQRRARQWAAMALLLALGIPLGLKWGPPGWRRVKLFYWQRQALRYSAPVAGIAGKATRASLIWRRFSDLMEPPGAAGDLTLFLHPLSNSRGEARLVAVECRRLSRTWNGANAPQAGSAFLLWATAVRPAGLFSPASQITSGPMRLIMGSLASARPRWYAGHPDPSDPSHLTIVYDLNGTHHIIDGFLGDDDSIVLQARRQTPALIGSELPMPTAGSVSGGG